MANSYQPYNPWGPQVSNGLMNPNPTYQQSYAQRPYAPVSGAIPQYYQAPQPSTPQQNNSGINWVQGKEAAKAYSLKPGETAILMDSDSNHFYIKSVDASGMPYPIRTFTYAEEAEEHKEDTRQSGSPDMSKYITKEDFGRMLEEYLGPSKKDGK